MDTTTTFSTTTKTVTALAAGIALITFSVAPVVPENMQIMYAYEYDCVGHVQQVLGLDSIWRDPEYSPEPCTGNMGIAAFTDSNGNHVFEQLSLDQYHSMEGVEGQDFNPKKDEFKSLLDAYLLPAITPTPVSAAIFRVATGSASGSGPSIVIPAPGATFAEAGTFADNNDGINSNRFLVAAGLCNGTANDAITQITYNGVAATMLVSSAFPPAANNGFFALGVLKNPAYGAHNTVVTCNAASAGNAARVAIYAGVYQSAFDGISSSTMGAASTTNYNTIYVSNSGAWHVSVFRHDAGNAETFTNCDLATIDGGFAIVDSGDTIKSAGNHTCLGSTSGSNEVGALGVAIWPAATDFPTF